jgi:hypothetical protein
MSYLDKLLNKGLEVFDNIKDREFQLDLANAQRNHEATLNAREFSQNPNAGSQFDFTSKQLTYGALGLVGLALLGVVVAKAV